MFPFLFNGSSQNRKINERGKDREQGSGRTIKRRENELSCVRLCCFFAYTSYYCLLLGKSSQPVPCPFPIHSPPSYSPPPFLPSPCGHPPTQSLSPTPLLFLNGIFHFQPKKKKDVILLAYLLYLDKYLSYQYQCLYYIK